MPGLRNSGIDTSAWYLAGYSGTELLVNDPKFIDPTAVFGAHLPTLVAALDLNFAQSDLLGGTFTRSSINASAQPTSENSAGKLLANQSSATVPVWQRGPLGGAVIGLRLNPYQRNNFGTDNNLETANWGKTNMTAAASDLGVESNSPFAGQTVSTLLTGGVGTFIRDTFFSNASYSPSIDNVRNYMDGWFKAGTTSEFFLGFRSNLAPTVNYGGILVDLAAGTVTTQILGNGQVADSWIIPYPDGWYRCGVIGQSDTTTTADDDRCSIVLTSGGAHSHSVGGQTLRCRALSGDGMTSGLYGPGYGHLRSSGSLGFSTNAETYTNTGFSLAPGVSYTILYDYDLFITTGGSTSAGQAMHHVGSANSPAGTESFSILTATNPDQVRYFIESSGTTRLNVEATPLRGRNRVVLRLGASDSQVYRNGVLLGSGTGGLTADALDNLKLSGDFAGGTIMRRVSVYSNLSAAEAATLSGI